CARVRWASGNGGPHMFALLLAVAALPPGTRLLDAISYRQVTILPIVRTAETPAGDYLTLREGLAGKLVSLTEHGDVNSVIVQNRSTKALLLVGGEMIVGGQQDRILGRSEEHTSELQSPDHL